MHISKISSDINQKNIIDCLLPLSDNQSRILTRSYLRKLQKEDQSLCTNNEIPKLQIKNPEYPVKLKKK